MAAASRLIKLRAMSGAEIAARLRYHGYTAYERQLHRRGRLTSPDQLRHAVRPELARDRQWPHDLLRRAEAPAFFACLDDPDATRALVLREYEAEHQAARAAADRAAAGDLEFFGRRFAFGADIDWHADPVTGARWPIAYHRDVPVHGGDIGFGDVKHVWEINRHQFFVDLAKVVFLDRSARHLAALTRLLRDWTSAVPYATGAPWACALEPAFRAWSWLWSYHLVRAADLLDDETHVLWLGGFFDHGRFLHRHLERYSSPYNHLAGEASALFALGVSFPEFREAGAWAARGRDVLESTVAAQFHADGGSVEQSTFYHHATLGFYLLAAALGRQNRRDLSPETHGAIQRGLEFSAALVQPDGRQPRIGGADDGKPIRLEHLPFWDFRPYQAIGAALYGRADFKSVAGRFWEDALWVTGPAGAAAFDALPARTPPLAVALPASGYFAARSSWAPDADYLLFDCGEQAAGLRRDDVPSAAHGHADCLAAVVVLGGREVLVDPGFFCYNGDPAWEVHFRKTRAHNTVVVDGEDQARHVSKMAWCRTFAARYEGWSAADGSAWAQGSHDGYQRLPAGVSHRRTVCLRPDGWVAIRDELTGTPGHQVEATFQFAAGGLETGGDLAVFDGRFELAWVGSTAVRCQTVQGGDGPADGWIATSLGVRVPAPRLVLHMTMTASPVVLLTVVADRLRATGRDRARVQTSGTVEGGLLRAAVAGSHATDVILAGVERPVVTPDVDSDAPLVVLRRRDDAVTEAFQAGGTRVRIRAGEPRGRGGRFETVAVR